MAKTYKVTFKPVEPYFFGNEKNFAFPGQKQESLYASSYFIKSENAPSQSTILGALRYVFLPYKKADYSYEDYEREANKKAIGEKSFNVESESIQEFGIIKKISPVFIYGKNNDGEGITLIPTPMDHNRSDNTDTKNKEKIKPCIYSPFDEYLNVNTTEENKLYAVDFDVKEGIEHSYVSLGNNEIYSETDLFETDLRIGINRAEKNDGFFKKEYCMLKNNFAFAVYAEIDIDVAPEPKCVFLGQGKSAFTVTFTEEADTLECKVKSFIENFKSKRAPFPFIYCLSDCFVKDFDNSSILFCAIDTKDYRTFETIGKGRVKKGHNLYRLLKAGSVIITENPETWIEKNMNENANNIGFNTYVISGGK